MKHFVWVTVGLVLIDQITKILARMFFLTPIEVTPFFSLRMVENDGIAFSWPFPMPLLIVITILFVVGISWLLHHDKFDHLETPGALFILAGGIGNLIDRVIFSGVTDFLSFWNFPLFNFADVFICFGIVLFLLPATGSQQNA